MHLSVASPATHPARQPEPAAWIGIGRQATMALYDELQLAPKPGLVTLEDTGSHTDMDSRTFMRSLLALRSYFPDIAKLGAQGAPFEALQGRGLLAEEAMLKATGGVNTHRGAIFMLGLLCAAAGAVHVRGQAWSPASLRAALWAHWGEALAQRAKTPSKLPGGLAAQRHGLRSASQEAAAGFPHLFEIAIPALDDALQRGLSWELARLDTLFHLMAHLDDSNLAHRGGLEGLRFAQRCARDFLAQGGAAHPEALPAARHIGLEFVRRRLSPGGSADTLAAACWAHRLCTPADPGKVTSTP